MANREKNTQNTGLVRARKRAQVGAKTRTKKAGAIMQLSNEVRDVFQRLKEEEQGQVRIALFGQPGAGKSSLINAITGQRLARVGVTTDTTKSAVNYEWQSLYLVDLPGYGTKEFPRKTYFERFDLLSYDVFICCYDGKHRADDVDFFRLLQEHGKPCLFVRNKVDALFQEGHTTKELQQSLRDELADAIHEDIVLIFTSCRKGHEVGIDELQDAIAARLGEVERQRFFRSAKAYSATFLKAKKKACERYVVLAAGASAANALNPIPGCDISVDVGILLGLFSKIKSVYGIDGYDLEAKTVLPKALAPIANRIIAFASKEGLMILLKKFAGRIVAKSLLKWVPFVGQMIAASAGFGITLAVGKDYLNDCHCIAEYILDQEMNNCD
jgi:GTP-binding protein EngB required for normal cell division/uncharacterized protein (DUF697 family)